MLTLSSAFLLLFYGCNFTGAVCCLMLIQNNFANRARADITAVRIFYTDDTAFDIRLNITVLKSEVAAFGRAVLQHKPFSIAQRLRADNFTAY